MLGSVVWGFGFWVSDFCGCGGWLCALSAADPHKTKMPKITLNPTPRSPKTQPPDPQAPKVLKGLRAFKALKTLKAPKALKAP